MPRLPILFVVLMFLLVPCGAGADYRSDPREQALSDALDLWHEGRLEPLYDSLSHRGSTSRERFVTLLKDAGVKPACCHLKLNSFRLISEKPTTAKVFAVVGMEGWGAVSGGRLSREFTLDHEEGRWKVRLIDIKALAGQAGTRKNKKQ